MKFKLSENDLVNPNKMIRMPVCICVDASVSMKGYRRDMEKELKDFLNQIRENNMLKFSADICIVTYAEDFSIFKDFGTLDTFRGGLPSLAISDKKARLGMAVQECVRLLNKRKSDYRVVALNYRQPNLIIFSSGESEDDTEKASRVVQSMQKDNVLSVIPVLFGDAENASVLRKFSIDGNVLYGGETGRLGDLLRNLGESMERLSESTAVAYDSLLSQMKKWKDYRV